MIIRRGIATKLVLYLFRNPNSRINYASKLRKEIDCTYATLIQGAQKLRKRGFLELIKRSNRKYFKLTIEGKMIAQELNKLDKLLWEDI